jgi:Sec-independent protein secretion pathway component TatC
MALSRPVQFVVTILVALFVIFPLSALLTPPDPFTQLIVAGVLMLVALAVAYYLSYGGGYESIRDR